MKLTAAIITKNEQERIGRCIRSLEFCNQILVIDDDSNDNTRKIAEDLGAEVYNRKMEGDYSAQRNYALDKAVYQWVLFVDADEYVTSELAGEIERFLGSENKAASAADFRRKNFFLGRLMEHGEHGKSRVVRLGKKNKGLWKRKVHEYWDINGPRHHFATPLLHDPDEPLSDTINKLNKYSSLHAQENFKEGKRANLFKILLWPIGKFINNYFVKQAFRDGTYGYVSSVLMSLHSFLSWSKLWLIQNK